MGYIRHDAVIAVVADYHPDTIERIAAFRETLPEEFRKYLVGPVVGINGYHSYAFLTDGSKEGWGYSDEGQRYREAFAQIALAFRHDDGSGPSDVIAVSFGGDYQYEVEKGGTIWSSPEAEPVR